MEARGDFPRWRRNAVSATGHGELYAYDRLHRLAEMARGTLSGDRQHVNDMQFTQDWTLDPTGNWNGFTQTDATESGENLDQSRWQNAANEITRVARRYGADWATPEYDRAGNMTVIPKPENPTTTFTGTYDAWNRLVHLSGINATYRYDAFNRRVTTLVDSTERHFYYTADWQCIEERLDSSSNPDRQYVWGLRYIDDLVLRDRDTNANGDLDERLYALQDANWNVTAIINAAGDVQERYSYTPYGVPTVMDASFNVRSASFYDWETRYAGYRWDAESGLYQVRWRFLNSWLGLWLTRDPISLLFGARVYAYCIASPLNIVDPYGLQERGPGGPGTAPPPQFSAEVMRAFSVDARKMLPQQQPSGEFDYSDWRQRFTEVDDIPGDAQAVTYSAPLRVFLGRERIRCETDANGCTCYYMRSINYWAIQDVKQSAVERGMMTPALYAHEMRHLDLNWLAARHLTETIRQIEGVGTAATERQARNLARTDFNRQVVSTEQSVREMLARYQSHTLDPRGQAEWDSRISRFLEQHGPNYESLPPNRR